MAAKRRKKKCKKVYCVMAGKSKKRISCHSTKTAAKKAAKSRRTAGRKARVVQRCAK